MTSIRARLLFALLAVVTLVSAVAGTVTYRRVLAETSSLFDYQLRQMALSLRSQVSLAPRLELPPEQGETDFVVQIWDPFGARVYLSRPGLPTINQVVLGYANLTLEGRQWRAFGLQTADGVLQIAQPVEVRAKLARSAAFRVIVPLVLLLPILFAAVAWVARSSLQPLKQMAAEVERRDAGSLEPLETNKLPAELQPLVAELNRLLTRLKDAFATQRAFISDAAHELRSPLTALRLQLQLLERAGDEAASHQARGNLGAAVDRATHLVEQLLTLARSDPQDTRAELVPLELGAAVRAGIADTHALAVERGIELGLEAPREIFVNGDFEALRTLVRNLVDNAVRYTERGGHVEIKLEEAEGCPVLQVADTGPGIPEADRERVFDRFYRRVGTEESGTGLGLAIVRAIADVHRARLSLEQAQIGGLCVSVTFPPIGPLRP